MTALIVKATPHLAKVRLTARVAYQQLLQAADAFAEARMRSALPDRQWRKFNSCR